MEHLRRFSSSILPRLLAVAVLVLIAVSTAHAVSQSPKPFASVEVAFTDNSTHGMLIMPASCPSNPGDADAPYGCGGYLAQYTLCPDGVNLAPNNDVNQCTCAEGNTIACINNHPLCPDGVSTAPNGNVSQCTCAEGNAAACTNGSGNPGGNGGNCPVGYTFEANACAFTGCPLGYSQQGTQCIFQGCPNGYVQQGTQCVFVGCSAGYICLNGNQYYENAQCSISASATQQCNYGCSGGVCLPPPAPAIATWQVKPTLVKSGETAVIAWQAQNVSSCTVVGSNGDGNGSNSTGTWTGTSGSQVSSKLTGQTIYTITCQGLPGSNPASASAQTTVNIVPTFNEQ